MEPWFEEISHVIGKVCQCQYFQTISWAKLATIERYMNTCELHKTGKILSLLQRQHHLCGTIPWINIVSEYMVDSVIWTQLFYEGEIYRKYTDLWIIFGKFTFRFLYHFKFFLNSINMNITSVSLNSFRERKVIHRIFPIWVR